MRSILALYTEGLKNWEFAKEAAQIFRLERAALPKARREMPGSLKNVLVLWGGVMTKKMVRSRRRTKTNFSITMCITMLCSCSGNQGTGLRVGIDPTFAPMNFEEQQPFVNAFVEEMLIDVSRFTGLKFEKVSANWDDLLEGLDHGVYDVAITSMPPYNFNLAKYDFTHNFLELGPVLIIPANANYSDLKSLSGELVGVVTGDPSVLVVEKYPEVILRSYNTIPDLLNAVASGEIEAAVLDRLPALSYVRDLYAGTLKIGTGPLNNLGLHAITLKGKSEKFVRLFNQYLEQMKKKKALDDLQKKWNL